MDIEDLKRLKLLERSIMKDQIRHNNHSIFDKKIIFSFIIIFIGFGLINYYYYNSSINLTRTKEINLSHQARLNLQILRLWKELLEVKDRLNYVENKILNNKSTCKFSSINKIIQEAFALYEADKIGIFDYAAEYAGGKIISTPNTVPYPTNLNLNLFGLINLYTINSKPEYLIQTDNSPGKCFAFYRNYGRIRMQLEKKISITSVTLEHNPLIYNKTAAPKDFQVIGLETADAAKGVNLGNFTYDINSKSIQTFPVLSNNQKSNLLFEFVELNIKSNYGKKEFTCVYRFRVHSN